jgi:hypothetical protein
MSFEAMCTQPGGELRELYAHTALMSMVTAELPATPSEPFEHVIHSQKLCEMVTSRFAPLVQQLESIGIRDVDEFVQIYLAAFLGDLGMMDQIYKVMLEREIELKKPHEVPAAEIAKISNSERNLAIANEIVGRAKSYDKPELNIVVGPFGGGKTETIRKKFPNHNNEYLILDLDELRPLLMDDYDATNQAHINLVRTESWKLSDLIFKMGIEQNKKIIIQTGLHRESWLDDPNIKYMAEHGHSINAHVILRPFTDSYLRNVDRHRSVFVSDLLGSMNGMKILEKMVLKYPNIFNITLQDYYPLVKRETIVQSQLYYKEYLQFLKFVEQHPEVFSRENVVEDLGVIN